MIKKTVVLIVVLMVSVIAAAETSVIPLPDVNKPEEVMLDKDQLYIREGASIYIYSRPDFKLVKKFGKKGEGPGEIKSSPQIPIPLVTDVQTNHIAIHNLGKITLFSKEGTFVKDVKFTNPIMLLVRPFGKGYVGAAFTGAAGGERIRALGIYDEKMNLVKEIEKVPDVFQMGKGTRVLTNNPIHIPYKDKVFVAWHDVFEIKVYDYSGKELYRVKHKIEKVKVTEDFKEKIETFFKTDPQYKNFYDFIKPIIIPEYYPDVLGLAVSGDIIYVTGANGDDEKQFSEFYLFDIKGKFLKRVMVPLKMSTPVMPYPNTIFNGKLYQIIEDEEAEEWALHINEIK